MRILFHRIKHEYRAMGLYPEVNITVNYNKSIDEAAAMLALSIRSGKMDDSKQW